MNRLVAEFIGTFWLVFGTCGSAVLAAGIPEVGIGLLGVSLAFGLTVLTMPYAVGRVSGGHFNPAVTLGRALAGRFGWGVLMQYWIAQVLGGTCGAAVLFAIASGAPDWSLGGFASNGYGALSPGGYGLFSLILGEVVLTAFFVIANRQREMREAWADLTGPAREGANACLAELQSALVGLAARVGTLQAGVDSAWDELNAGLMAARDELSAALSASLQPPAPAE